MGQEKWHKGLVALFLLILRAPGLTTLHNYSNIDRHGIPWVVSLTLPHTLYILFGMSHQVQVSVIITFDIHHILTVKPAALHPMCILPQLICFRGLSMGCDNCHLHHLDCGDGPTSLWYVVSFLLLVLLNRHSIYSLSFLYLIRSQIM